MPFTPAHAVAALPFRKMPLYLDALVVGCLSPDFEYFLRLAATGYHGHTIGGLFWFDLPLALAVLIVWYRYVSKALQTLAPGLLPTACEPMPSLPVRFVGKPLLVTCISILIGATTHLVWDSFTHPTFWPYRHFQALRETIGFGTGFAIPIYKLLQHASTLIGLSILVVWWARWARRKSIAGVALLQPSAWYMLCGAGALALARLLLPLVFTKHYASIGVMLSSFIVTFITALWFELVWFGHKLRNAR